MKNFYAVVGAVFIALIIVGCESDNGNLVATGISVK